MLPVESSKKLKSQITNHKNRRPSKELSQPTKMLKLNNVIALKGFVKHLKNRLASMEEMAWSGGWCGKLVTVNSYGKVKTKRCYGDTTSGRCFNCDYTGFDCRGGCGDDVAKAGDFCSSTCKGMYYNF